MTNSELENRWNGIDIPVHTQFKSVKIASDCSCDLYIGHNTDAERCLILSVPGINLGISDEIKEHVGLHYYDQSGHVVITLFSTEFHRLFNDLIISIYDQIKSNPDNASSARELLSVFRTWCEFFSERAGTMLSREEIQGLFGELMYLNQLLEMATSTTVNDILATWLGPYDKGQDFHLPDRNVEVKTKLVSSNDVRISSEYQLSVTHGKELHLRVYSVEIGSADDRNLKDVFETIRNATTALQGDIKIPLKALARKGITPDNISLYDNWKFRLLHSITFDCKRAGFPRLGTETISPNLRSIQYSLSIAGLEEYIIDSQKYS